jgi:hypothetical protein
MRFIEFKAPKAEGNTAPDTKTPCGKVALNLIDLSPDKLLPSLDCNIV